MEGRAWYPAGGGTDGNLYTMQLGNWHRAEKRFSPCLPHMVHDNEAAPPLVLNQKPWGTVGFSESVLGFRVGLLFEKNLMLKLPFTLPLGESK